IASRTAALNDVRTVRTVFMAAARSLATQNVDCLEVVVAGKPGAANYELLIAIEKSRRGCVWHGQMTESRQAIPIDASKDRAYSLGRGSNAATTNRRLHREQATSDAMALVSLPIEWPLRAVQS